MNSIFSEKLFEVTLPKVIEGNLVDFWLATHYDEENRDVEETIKFSDRREIFLWVLERLLREGQIKLHKNGIFLEDTIKDQIDFFRSAWPKSDRPYPDHPDVDFCLWFYDSECPAGVAWRQNDGHYEIID
jgi:hypothetical protein